jgi:hypothetical protein
MTLLAYWPVATGSWLIILLVACCVVMMWLMMRFMGSSTDSSSNDTNEIAVLRGEATRLHGEPPRDAQQQDSQLTNVR